MPREIENDSVKTQASRASRRSDRKKRAAEKDALNQTQKSERENERQDADQFGSTKLLAYSSFSHIEDVRSLSFAVGLREDSNIEETIGRIIPMSKIIPGVKMEKQRKGVAKNIDDCQIPECIARQNRYRDLADANLPLRNHYEELETQMERAVKKFSMMEKANKVVESANEKLQQQLDSLKGRSSILDVEVSQGQKVNSELKKKLAGLESEIGTLRAQAEERRIQREQAERSSSVEVVFGPRKFPPCPDSNEVTALSNWHTEQNANDPLSASRRQERRVRRSVKNLL